MGKPKGKQQSDNSVTFQDIAQVLNKNVQVINNLTYKYNGRLNGIGKPSESAYASIVTRGRQEPARRLQGQRSGRFPACVS